jgi:hypothetical protein
MSEQKRNYMLEIDDWLTKLLTDFAEDATVEIEDVKRQIKDKLLESYRNGQAAGPKRSQRSASRRRLWVRRDDEG